MTKDLPVLSVDQIKQATQVLMQLPSKEVANGLVMLKANYRSPDRTISATQLAKAAGYTNYGSANIQYGKFAHQICNQFGYEPNVVADDNLRWTYAICTASADSDQHGHFQWILRLEVAQALEDLGLVERIDFPDALTDIANCESIAESLSEKARDAYIRAELVKASFGIAL